MTAARMGSPVSNLSRCRGRIPAASSCPAIPGPPAGAPGVMPPRGAKRNGVVPRRGRRGLTSRGRSDVRGVYMKPVRPQVADPGRFEAEFQENHLLQAKDGEHFL